MNQHSSSSDERVVAKAIADFFKGFPQGRAAPQEEFDRARAYAELLSKYSVRSVRIALERIGRRGEAFAPSAPQIAAECEKIAIEYRSTDVRAVPRLAAPQPARADPERMKAGFAKLLADLRAATDPLVKREGKPMSEITKSEAEAALERMLADPKPLPQLSERVRATFWSANLDEKRCLITGNLVGTDTWKVGSPCMCENCSPQKPTPGQLQATSAIIKPATKPIETDEQMKECLR